MTDARRRLGRRLTAAVLVVGVASVAAPVLASNVDTKRLVLRPGDVPEGFTRDERTTYPLPNTRVVRRNPELRNLVERSGRVDGRISGYLKRSGGRLLLIASIVDVCRRPDGARVLFRWHDAKEKGDNALRARDGARAFRHERAGVGTPSVIYIGGPPDYSVRVLWVQRRVLASVWTFGVGRKATLELARIQQRLIANELG
jgi:hypothetical protein